MADYTVAIQITANSGAASREIGRFSDGVVDKVKSMSSRSNGHVTSLAKMFTAGLGGAVSKIGKALMSLKTIAIGALAGWGVEKLASDFIDTASGFEKMQLSLDTITKGEGKEWFEKLNEWALKMPVNTEKAIQSFISMRAMGLTPTIEQMTTLVDTMSALGGEGDMLKGISRALGQIQTKGKVSAEELMQLAEQGVPVFEILKEKFGEVDTASLDAKEAIAAIFEGLEERFGGQSEKMQNTWAGMVESLKSYWKEFQRLVMESGVMDWMKEKMSWIIEKLDEMYQSGELKEWANEISLFVTGALERLSGWFAEKWPGIKSAFIDVSDWFKTNWSDIKSVLEGVGPVLMAVFTAAEWVAKGFMLVGQAIGTEAAIKFIFIEKVIQTATKAFNILKDTISGVIDKIKDFYATLKGKVELIMSFLGAGSTIKPLGEKIDEMQDKMAGFASQVNNITLSPIVNFSGVSEQIQEVGNEYIERLKMLAETSGGFGGTNIATAVSKGYTVRVLGGELKGFQEGTPYVPRTGIYYLHEGEKVIPKAQADVSNIYREIIYAAKDKSGQRAQKNVTINGDLVINVPATAAPQTAQDWRMIVREHIIPELEKIN